MYGIFHRRYYDTMVITAVTIADDDRKGHLNLREYSFVALGESPLNLLSKVEIWNPRGSRKMNGDSRWTYL
jgi:hypothetical protein